MKKMLKQTCIQILEIVCFLYILLAIKPIEYVGRIYSHVVGRTKWHFINAIYIPARISDMKHTDLVTTEEKIINFFSMSTKSHLVLWISGVTILFTMLVGAPSLFYLGFKTIDYVRAESELSIDHQGEFTIVSNGLENEDETDSELDKLVESEGSDITVDESVTYQDIQQSFVVIANSGLNVRSTPSLEDSQNIVKTLSFGDEVKVSSFIDEDWAKLDNGTYVYREYIKSY